MVPLVRLKWLPTLWWYKNPHGITPTGSRRDHYGVSGRGVLQIEMVCTVQVFQCLTSVLKLRYPFRWKVLNFLFSFITLPSHYPFRLYIEGWSSFYRTYLLRLLLPRYQDFRGGRGFTVPRESFNGPLPVTPFLRNRTSTVSCLWSRTTPKVISSVDTYTPKRKTVTLQNMFNKMKDSK